MPDGAISLAVFLALSRLGPFTMRATEWLSARCILTAAMIVAEWPYARCDADLQAKWEEKLPSSDSACGVNGAPQCSRILLMCDRRCTCSDAVVHSLHVLGIPAVWTLLIFVEATAFF